jgi:hypothetical protein
MIRNFSTGYASHTCLFLKRIIFWDVTPCSLLSCNRRFGGTHRLHLQGRRNNFCLPPVYLLVLAEIISSTLKMEATCSSETSVATQQTIQRYIPEDDTLHNHCCENLKSYVSLFISESSSTCIFYFVKFFSLSIILLHLIYHFLCKHLPVIFSKSNLVGSLTLMRKDASLIPFGGVTSKIPRSPSMNMMKVPFFPCQRNNT